MLNIKNLSFSVSGKQLLDIHSLNCAEGEFVSLLGANGAGKSTLFKAISGELLFKGEISLHQKPIKQWKNLSLAKHLGVLPQVSQLDFPFSVEEVVSLGLIPLTASKAEGRQLVLKAMKATDTIHFQMRAYSGLSGGERQRVHLARVLVQLSQAEQSPLLLLDEPTSAQDLGQQHQMLSLAQSLCHDRGWGIIAILHDLNHALRYSDRCWLLDDGQVIDTGPPDMVLNAPQVNRVWGYVPQVVVSGDGKRMLL